MCSGRTRLSGQLSRGSEMGISRNRVEGGISVPEHQLVTAAATEQVNVRDFCVRLISVMSMVAAALALLLAVQPS